MTSDIFLLDLHTFNHTTVLVLWAILKPPVRCVVTIYKAGVIVNLIVISEDHWLDAHVEKREVNLAYALACGF